MSDIREYPEIGRCYDHYKGGKYEVITMATHTETNEPLVIYKSLLFGSIYARPLEEWNSKATLNGKKVERFKKESF